METYYKRSRVFEKSSAGLRSALYRRSGETTGTGHALYRRSGETTGTGSDRVNSDIRCEYDENRNTDIIPGDVQRRAG